MNVCFPVGGVIFRGCANFGRWVSQSQRKQVTGDRPQRLYPIAGTSHYQLIGSLSSEKFLPHSHSAMDFLLGCVFPTLSWAKINLSPLNCLCQTVLSQWYRSNSSGGKGIIQFSQWKDLFASVPKQNDIFHDGKYKTKRNDDEEMLPWIMMFWEIRRYGCKSKQMKYSYLTFWDLILLAWKLG